MNTAEKPKERSIEMRLAEIEDKLAQLQVSDEEMKTYEKVSNLMGMASAGPAQYTPDPNSPVLPRMRFINRQITPRVPRIQRYVCECYECQCGPCAGWGGGFGGGQFGGMGY